MSVSETIILKFAQNKNLQTQLSDSYFSFSFSDSFQSLLCPISVDSNNLDSVNLNNVLSRACYFSSEDVVKACLAHHANVDAIDESGRTPLHSAAASNSTSILEILLRSIETSRHAALVNKRDYKGWTPLHVSVCKGHVEATSILLKAGADIHIDMSHSCFPCKATPTHSMPIHFAAMKSKAELINVLVQFGATLRDRDQAGRVPLHYALHKNAKYDFVEYLVKRDPETINMYDDDMRTPLYAAALNGLTQICCLFIQHGADVTKKDVWDLTPSLCASLSGYSTTV